MRSPVGPTLAEVLRDESSLTGTKVACGEGHCGACTVLVDDVPTLSCITLVHTLDGANRDDDRGPARAPDGRVVRAADALQCGFCTPGQIVSAVALVHFDPGAEALKRFATQWQGNLCRCGAYPKIEEAIRTWRE